MGVRGLPQIKFGMRLCTLLLLTLPGLTTGIRPTWSWDTLQAFLYVPTSTRIDPTPQTVYRK